MPVDWFRARGWTDVEGTRIRETSDGYRLLVQTVRTDVDEYSIEAEVSCNGTSYAQLWLGDVSDSAIGAAMAWCEGVAAVADWHDVKSEVANAD